MMHSKFKPNTDKAIAKWSFIALFFIAFLMLPPTALAGPGHDHGDHDHATNTPAGQAAPRVAAHSEAYELVGIVQDGGLTLYLDRYASNEPVTQARLEVDGSGIQGLAEPQADGSYRLQHPALRRPGQLALSFTVTVGQDTDLLAGDLVLPDPEADHDHPPPRLRKRWLVLGAATVLALVALAWWRLRRQRPALPMLAALGLAVGGLGWPPAADAGPGHDHGDAAPASARGDAPQRLPNGQVFLPKPSQRHLGLRTEVTDTAPLSRVVELTGLVVADPNAGGKVQPTQGGRIEAGPRGLPQLGQRVRKGEVLALVRSAPTAIERANQTAQVAELRTSLDAARRRAARLLQLEGTVAQKDIDAAQAEVDSLGQRLAAVGPSLNAAETLVAPVSGVIAASHVSAGQVVEPRELLFEIVDPGRLLVEARAFDPSVSTQVAAAHASTATGQSIPLRLVGAGQSLREGALPVVFAAHSTGTSLPLAVGQPVKVLVQMRDTQPGHALPASALVKSPSNQDMVWVHTDAELFEPRPVRALPLDGARVAVVQGLKAGERVVTEGASLVNQVR